MFKDIKFVCISNKGGVGKTTISSQILVPYLYTKNKKPIDFVMLDDVNKTAQTLKKTEIMKIHQVPTNDISGLIDHLWSPEACVLDVAGNEAANKIITEIGDSERTKNIWWVVPLSDGDEDVLNAMDTYSKIKAVDNNPKIIFALTRAISLDEKSYQTQFVYIFGHKNINIPFSLFDEMGNKPFIVMTALDSYNISKVLGKTIFELGSEKYIDQIRKEIDVLEEKREKYFNEKGKYNEKDIEESKKMGELLRTCNKFKKYTSDVLDLAFKTLDNTITANAAK